MILLRPFLSFSPFTFMPFFLEFPFHLAPVPRHCIVLPRLGCLGIVWPGSVASLAPHRPRPGPASPALAITEAPALYARHTRFQSQARRCCSWENLPTWNRHGYGILINLIEQTERDELVIECYILLYVVDFTRLQRIGGSLEVSIQTDSLPVRVHRRRRSSPFIVSFVLPHGKTDFNNNFCPPKGRQPLAIIQPWLLTGQVHHATPRHNVRPFIRPNDEAYRMRRYAPQGAAKQPGYHPLS